MGGRRSCSVLSSLLLRSLGRFAPSVTPHRSSVTPHRSSVTPHHSSPPHSSPPSPSLVGVAYGKPSLLAICGYAPFICTLTRARGWRALLSLLTCPLATPYRSQCRWHRSHSTPITPSRGLFVPSSWLSQLCGSFRLNCWALISVRAYVVLFSLGAVSPRQLISKCVYHRHSLRAVIKQALNLVNATSTLILFNSIHLACCVR